MNRITNLTIHATDRYPLAATLFSPSTWPVSVVLIASATGVSQRFYREFAEYLTTQSFLAITFDYRGVGGSRPSSLRGFSALMRDWAERDTAGVIDYVRAHWAAVPLVMVGHSFGGQALGLAPNNSEVSRALLIASMAGYWRLFSFPERYRVYALLCLIAPLITRVLGYMPAQLGLGEDIPFGVLMEWVRWVKQPSYFFNDATLASVQNFARYTGALRAMGFTDDPWATQSAIEVLLRHFSGTSPEFYRVQPSDGATSSLGHFGFFRNRNRELLWPSAADWLSQG